MVSVHWCGQFLNVTMIEREPGAPAHSNHECNENDSTKEVLAASFVRDTICRKSVLFINSIAIPIFNTLSFFVTSLLVVSIVLYLENHLCIFNLLKNYLLI